MANGLIGKVTAGGGTHLIASTAYFTCDTAAATAAKIAKAADTTLDSFTLITGMTIYVKFTYANGVASPTLTLQTNGGTQILAAKSIKRYGTTAPSTSAATSWRAGAVVAFTYDGTNWVEVTAIDDNSNTYDRLYFSNSGFKAGADAIVAANIVTANSSGLYQHLKSGAAFDITMPIIYASGAVNANTANNSGYLTIPFAIATTQSMTLTAYKPIYIQGTLNGKMFTPSSTTPLTQTEPTSDDGKLYMYLGYATTTTIAYLMPYHPIYVYKDGAFRLYTGYAETDGVKTISGTIPTSTSSPWTIDATNKTITIADSKITANSVIEWTLASSATLDQAEAFADAWFVDSATANGSATIKALNTMPTTTIPVVLYIVGEKS